MTKKTRDILLIVAAVLLAGAIIWSMDIARDDPLETLAREFDRFGLSLAAEDFYVLGGAREKSVSALLEGQDVTPMREASLEAGFPSDTDKSGDISVLLAQLDGGVLTVYLVDGEVELAFIQTEEGEVLPLK